MKPSKRTIYAGLAAIGISLGAAGIATAASSPGTAAKPVATATAVTADTTATDATTPDTTPTDPAPTDSSATDPNSGSSTTGSTSSAQPKHDHTPPYTSSVTVPVPADGSEPTTADVQAAATVTEEQAIAAAVANTPGTAGEAELKSVAGNVVWEVDVTATAGGSYDVIVDAGNATVLDTHVEGGGGGHRGGGHHHPDDNANDNANDTADDGSTPTTTG